MIGMKSDHNLILEKLKSYNGENQYPFNASNIYQYGSRVYGTIKPDSDYDTIIISDQPNLAECCDEGIVYGHIYFTDKFQELIDEHEISALECLFLPNDKIIKQDKEFKFNLDLSKLRHSISAKASNSWVKAKKKLTVKEDFNREIALKSLFHSLRILEFGIQIAKYGKIVDYSAANHFYTQMLLYSTSDWEFFKKKYQPIYNSLATKFKKLAPK